MTPTDVPGIPLWMTLLMLLCVAVAGALWRAHRYYSQPRGSAVAAPGNGREMEYRYYQGRPAKHRSRQMKGLAWFFGFVPFPLFPLFLSGWAFFAGLKWLWRPKPFLGTVLNAAIFFFLCWFFLYFLITALLDGGRIVPYFKKPYEGRLGQGAANAGEALAAHCEELDRLAIRMNLAPLSRFGFNDDLDGEAVEWQDGAEGLRTVMGLIHGMAEAQIAWSESQKQATLADLEKLRAALERAHAQGVPFCLLLRFKRELWSRMEHAARKGWFA